MNGLSQMLMGKELEAALTVLPEYDNSIRQEDAATRLVELSNLFDSYIPSNMTTEIYSKLYLAMLRSLNKKNTKLAVKQRNCSNGIMGGSDSFSLIGCSGIGKSSAIMNSLNLISPTNLYEKEKPYSKIIPYILCQCPHDCSVKGLMLDILRQVDERLDSKFYDSALRARATTDMLIGSASKICLNHVGMLIIDEIQNVCNNRTGVNLVAMLTQLINSSGISICMVGTPESASFFESKMYLARRSIGLKFDSLPYDNYFSDFCKIVFGYQYTKNDSAIDDGIINWLYEHSGGLISMVVALIHDAQEIAILSGYELLDLSMLNKAYNERMQMLHTHIEPSIKKRSQTSKRVRQKSSNDLQATVQTADEPLLSSEDINIVDLVKHAKTNNLDVVDVLKKYIPVVEVAI